MSRTDSVKVQKGNMITEFCAEIAMYCIQNGKIFSIENPTNSIIWEMPCMKNVINHADTHKLEFQPCMWGGTRPKKTAFLTNSTELESLRKERTHQEWEHEKWGVSWNQAENG